MQSLKFLSILFLLTRNRIFTLLILYKTSGEATTCLAAKACPQQTHRDRPSDKWTAFSQISSISVTCRSSSFSPRNSTGPVQSIKKYNIVKNPFFLLLNNNKTIYIYSLLIKFESKLFEISKV